MVIPTTTSSSSSPSSPRPGLLSPRLQLAKSGSWRKYIKVPSTRKLQASTSSTSDPLVSSIVEQRRVKINEESNTIQTLPLLDNKLNEAIWYKKIDYELFEKDRQLTALDYRTKKKNGRPYIEREHTVRGLEDLCDISTITSSGGISASSPSSPTTSAAALCYPSFQSSRSKEDDDDDDDEEEDDDDNDRYLSPRRRRQRRRGSPFRLAAARTKCTPTRADHLNKVLAEQTRQRRKGIYPNTTMLREISCKSSKESRTRSAQLGEADALAGYVSSSRSLQRQVAGVMHNVSRKLQA